MEHEEFASRLKAYGFDYAKSTISTWRTGAREPRPDRNLASAIARILDIPVTDVLVSMGALWTGDPIVQSEGETAEFLQDFSADEVAQVRNFARFLVSQRGDKRK